MERFATSKLQRFEDLWRLRTFGFRGEALASIARVARLQVVSRTRQSECAWRAEFADGRMLEPAPRPAPGACSPLPSLFFSFSRSASRRFRAALIRPQVSRALASPLR